MGNGKMCDCCMEFTSLLQSYDAKRGPLDSAKDITISREEIETLILYILSWTQRQCTCCFREYKNFDRCNWALQILILVGCEILKNFYNRDRGRGTGASSSLSPSGNPGESSLTDSGSGSSPEKSKEIWDIEDKEKLLFFLTKIFQGNFPAYIAYKQHIQVKAEEFTPTEVQGIGQYCDTNDPDASPHLYRNIYLFCKTGGLAALQMCVKNQSPETLFLHQANTLVGLGVTIKTWLNFSTLLRFYVEFRSSVLIYLSKLVESDLKSTAARNMNEFIWTNVKDPIDAHLSFDKDGLDLAFKYFLSTTLTLRLAGITQITNHVNLLNEIMNSEHIVDSANLDQHLNDWLIENQVLEHLFGPNIHVEVIKLSNTLLNYMAMEGKITKDHIDIMWAAAQLKHCSRAVYDCLAMLITNMDSELVLHLRDLLWKLEPKEHTDASILLTSNLTRFMWSNAAAIHSSMLPVPVVGTGAILGQSRLGEVSSSENSVSVEASHSEDELPQLQLPRTRIISGKRQDAGVKPVCYKAGHLCKVVTQDSSDESVSVDEDQENMQVSSGGYVETHSDSDADEEKSGGEESPNKPKKRRVLRRKKSKSKSLEGSMEQESPNVTGDSVEMQENVAPEIELSRKKPALEISSGSGSASELLEPNAVMNELSNLVHMTDTPPNIQDFVAGPDLMENSDGGSYSSRLSNKSEKNMADFEGEESVGEEDLMQSLTPNQLADLASRKDLSIRLGGLGQVFGPRPIRPFGRRRRFLSAPSFNFQLETLCQPGQTLLWDLIQDDKITQLADGLAIEVQKSLGTLLCYNTDKMIKLKFIEGCIDNITKNRSIVVSLRLLPKLLSSYPQPRPADTYQLTMWVDREFQLRDKFFQNLKVFSNESFADSPFPFQAHLQVRMEFLTVLFSTLTSPEDFILSIDHLDMLWECLATDSRCADDLFIWLSNQVRIREQHALSPESLRHIYIVKIPSLPPETVTMHALTLFQQLCSIARTSGEQDVELAVTGMDYLWKIALCASRTDVSMAAIQYLNIYFISLHLEKEDEFIERCMSHLADATEELSQSNHDEAPLLRIQRALLLLKTHLETFRTRYAYHLRRWQLEGRGVGSHGQLVGEKGAVPIKVVIQPAGYPEKVILELQSTDYVADLRAEVAKWWEAIQSNQEKPTSTPVLGSLLTEGPVRMITQGVELSSEYDEKFISDVPIKDMQLVYVSMQTGRTIKRKDTIDCSQLPPPSRDKLPLILLLQSKYFEQLFTLMQSLSSIKASTRSGEAQPHTKAQVLSRRVWDILMLLPTNPSIHEGFTTASFQTDETSFKKLLDPASPQKLMYSLYIVEALVKTGPVKSKESIDRGIEPKAWRQLFIENGGLRHLFDVFASGVLESVDDGDWSEWKQDCLASLLKILCFLGIVTDDLEYLTEQLYDVNEISRKRTRRKFSCDKSCIPRLNDTMLSMMDIEIVLTRLTNILQACALPRDPNHYKTGFWGRAQVVHYAMALLVCWSFSNSEVRSALYSQKDFSQWLKQLVLEDPEPAVRREACTGLYKLCLGVSSDGKIGISFAPDLISNLLKCLMTSLTIRPPMKNESQGHTYEDGKEPYGPACRDYFWLLGRLIDCLDNEFVKESIANPDNCVIDLDGLSRTLSKAIVSRDYLETRHNTIADDGLVGLLTTTSAVMKHNPPFKSSKECQDFLKQVFDCLFALPSPQMRYLPKCKSQLSRSAAFDLLTEIARFDLKNYYLLQNLLLNQHQPNSHIPYSWDYWPHDDGRSPCGYVGLTNLGATCYMASCMQHLYMMPQARAAVLASKLNTQTKHEETLRELQKMFAYMLESERKAYNPRSFCKVYQMDHQPLNTGEQKDMAEFFIDLVSKLEEMTPELRTMVKVLFCGVTSNNVVSLDCTHVSRTLEEFYTVRCQVADMRTLYDSLNEVTVKDTLEGDNMYTCSQCGKKVRAEKRACFKKLPKLLCFNTMRYTFNMVTMMKEKVNTHFSFPMRLDMSGYVEKTLMPQQYQEEKTKKREGDSSSFDVDASEEDECYEYDLIGVTVHTGTADGGHYYSFIRDRLAPNKDKWYLFNDAEVKAFDPNQLAAECFGGEMNTKTYDSVTDKFMDFSFEKTNSAYMLFYERCTSPSNQLAAADGLLVPSLPGGSSQKAQNPVQIVPVQTTFELSKELEEWIWQDNTHFLRDKNIFEHTYFNFMWQACGYMPQSLVGQEDVTLLAAKLSATFFLETFIHAKEKPTMVQWVELLTKQLSASETAAAWFLDHMAENDWWPVQILLKCPNVMVRQMFQRLVIHVIQQIRLKQASLYLNVNEDMPIEAIQLEEYSNFSCVTRFIRRLLSLLETGAKTHLKHLAEYFSIFYDFSKLGEEECLFLVRMQTITTMANFYLGNKKEDAMEQGSEEEDEEEEVICIPTEKSKVASLERMIALIAILVEKSRDVDGNNALRLSRNDYCALTGKNFSFILQQIRDGINFQSTRNLIFSLCRWNNELAEQIIIATFQTILKHPENCHPFFKVLNLLAELTAMPPGLPPFTELILHRILDVADISPYQTLEWLATQVSTPRNKVVLTWCLETMGTWVEHFLIAHCHQRVRNIAASLLVSLVPNQHFRQGFRSTKMYPGHHCRELFSLNQEAMNIMHRIYLKLLSLLKPARHYIEATTHGTSKLTAYFAVLTYFTVSKKEKHMFGEYFHDLWNLFHPKLSEPNIACNHNKQALLLFLHHVCLDCPENVQRLVNTPSATKHIGFNYILADHDDQEVIMYNRTMLPAYYSILRMCCAISRSFSIQLSRHQNIIWAFRNISPYPNQYPAAVDELLKLMQMLASRPPDATEAELAEISQFRRNTLQLYLQILDGRVHFTTLIQAFRILVETHDDKIYVLCNGGLSLLFNALHSLHTMHHEATACHVTAEIVELLNIISDILRTFRPKDIHQMCDLQVARIINTCKEFPEVVRKLATLLNTYNNGDIRGAALETLTEFLYILPGEVLRTLVPLMAHCHSAYQEVQTSGMGHVHPPGPYFPKRTHNSLPLKSVVRPPRPMLQMSIPRQNREFTRICKGLENDYELQLIDFYAGYHAFIDLMCRYAFMRDSVNDELITLSTMVGVESISLRLYYFPKLWTEVFNSPTVDRKYVTLLVNTPHFLEYMEIVLTQERLALTNSTIYTFVASYLPQVYQQIVATTPVARTVQHIVLEWDELIASKVFDLEDQPIRYIADVKAITLLYTPVFLENRTNPLPPPAPNLATVLKSLHALLEFINSFATEKHLELSEGHPSKKRKVSSPESDQVNEPDYSLESPCSSKKMFCHRERSPREKEHMDFDPCTLRFMVEIDLFNILIGTINSTIVTLSSITPAAISVNTTASSEDMSTSSQDEEKENMTEKSKVESEERETNLDDKVKESDQRN